MAFFVRRKKPTFKSTLVRKHRISHDIRAKRKIFKRTKVFLGNIKTRFLAEYKYIIGGVVFILIVGGTVGIVFFSHFFDLTYVLVERSGLETNVSAITQKVNSYLSKNILFINGNEVKSTLAKTFPELKEIEVSKLLPRTLRVKVSEYELKSRIKIPSGTEEMFINEIGMLRDIKIKNDQLPLIEYKNQYELKDDSILNVLSPLLAFQDRNRIMDTAELRAILNTKAAFEKDFSLKVKLIRFFPLEREVHLVTEKGFEIWMDLADNVDEEINKLKAAQQNFNIYQIDLAYVDLRIKDKIIYCNKGSVCTKSSRGE